MWSHSGINDRDNKWHMRGPNFQQLKMKDVYWWYMLYSVLYKSTGPIRNSTISEVYISLIFSEN